MGSRRRQCFRSAFGARRIPGALLAVFYGKNWAWSGNAVSPSCERVARSDQARLLSVQSIGINKGKPFAPDERMKKILTEAAGISDATARTIGYPNSAWQLPFVGGYKFQTEPGILHLDGYNVCCAPPHWTTWKEASRRKVFKAAVAKDREELGF